MAEKHGSLSINSENIFPIIKKWLYSDHDIFARELISNGCDAITKLKKLDVMGEYTLPDDYKAEVQVIVNPEVEQGQELHGFTVLTAEPLPEIDGDAYTLSHPVSGAKLLYLRNDDRNKAFSIAFRTPPADDTGVFHILEHSVLCGSEKFPVKEPFVNLLKTSMQTFLNARTFDDKTLYPVASTNDQDLMNLADVYMDAVLHPDIYRKRQVFEQEGWHLEVADAEEGETDAGRRLTYNGVVYNEMKGALSDPTSVLYDQLQASLFPDTPYAFESGGTPEAIPTLTYEHYLE